jgi:hypothetical protein
MIENLFVFNRQMFLGSFDEIVISITFFISLRFSPNRPILGKTKNKKVEGIKWQSS